MNLLSNSLLRQFVRRFPPDRRRTFRRQPQLLADQIQQNLRFSTMRMAIRVLGRQFPCRRRRQDHLHLVSIPVDTEDLAAMAVTPRHSGGISGGGCTGSGGCRNRGGSGSRRGEWDLLSIWPKAVLDAAVGVTARVSLRVGKAKKSKQDERFGHIDGLIWSVQ